MSKKTHGGARPKSRLDDKRGGSRQGTGPLPKKVEIKPFNARKSDTTSVASLTIHRCNYCGTHWIDGYDEEIVGWSGDKATVTIAHEGIKEHHKEHCVKAAGYPGLPKFRKTKCKTT